MKKTLSVVLATYNEQQNIEKCLKSVKSIANEIIVVDGSSKDKTRELAKKLGAKVFKVKNKPIFHINKQLAVDRAKGDWILQLDADEQLTPLLRKEIVKQINQKDQPHNGFYLPRKNFFLTRFLTKGGQYPDYVIRLFKNKKGHFPCLSVHEQINIQGSVGYLTNDLLHYSDPDFNRYVKRFNRYTDLDAKDLFNKNQKPNLWIGTDYLVLKPWGWFLKTYFRHLGFVDGLPGFIFSIMSSFRFVVIYFKLWELTNENRS